MRDVYVPLLALGYTTFQITPTMRKAFVGCRFVPTPLTMLSKDKVQRKIDQSLNRMHELRTQGKMDTIEYKEVVATMNHLRGKLSEMRANEGYDENCGCIKKLN